MAHEPWAYEAAFRLHRRVLQSAAYAVLRNAEDAEDCVADVMTRLWQRERIFREERGSLRAFLAVCVRNEALSRVRKSTNRERIAQTLRDTLALPDPTDRVAERASVERALLALDHKQRIAVDLAYYRHFTHEEIASELGEPVGTIKSRLSTALRRLREQFAKEEARV